MPLVLPINMGITINVATDKIRRLLCHMSLADKMKYPCYKYVPKGTSKYCIHSFECICKCEFNDFNYIELKQEKNTEDETINNSLFFGNIEEEKFF